MVYGLVPQYVGNPLCGVRVEVARDMLVQVSRDRDAAVPEPSRRRLERNACPQQERRVRVPKVVEAHVGQTGPPQRQVEGAQHIPKQPWQAGPAPI